ncbi:N-acetylmuramidase family protein [Bacteroides sp.]|uniref:N-acetylmuramidase family protein n=1 Tax=Bacteroides sp. TaxID=29523 RepID=UPI00260AE8D9|nr:N-acetylmuramidase family protein [Bacteroides sp.]
MEIINSKSIKGSMFYAQILLIDQGYSIVLNGDYDKRTREAIIDFQRKHHLEADGIMGYKSWEALLLSTHETGKKLSENDFILAAQLLDVETAALKAIQKVETGGRGGFFAPGKPAILFEGHVFWAQLKEKGLNPENHVVGNENILYRHWDRTKYYGGIREYERLEQARKINLEAANSSASWGMFQVMGFNYAACGEKSVESFVNAMCESEFKQLMLSVRFIKEGGMLPALQAKKWDVFAKLYNGAGYKANNYDTKLSDAYNMFTENANKAK